MLFPLFDALGTGVGGSVVPRAVGLVDTMGVGSALSGAELDGPGRGEGGISAAASGNGIGEDVGLSVEGSGVGCDEGSGIVWASVGLVVGSTVSGMELVGACDVGVSVVASGVWL